MQKTHGWNRAIYLLWVLIYGSTVNQFVIPGRQRALEILNLQPGEKVLLVDVGTGAGTSYLPQTWM